MKIDGKQIANKILEGLEIKVKRLKEKNIIPHLAIILVGNDPASIAYINQKELKAESIGIEVVTYNLEPGVQNSELIKLINKLNNDKNIHGIIVQRPLPKQINEKKIAKTVSPKKDVDGFHPNSHFEMPIAMAVLKILRHLRGGVAPAAHLGGEFNGWLRSKKITVIGKGETGGKPIIDALQKMGIKPTIIDSKTIKPENLTRKADIIISAVGKKNILKPQMIKKGVALVGIGISAGTSAKLMGDYDQNEVKNIASFYTPTPGGVGPVNVAMLLKNTIIAAEN